MALSPEVISDNLPKEVERALAWARVDFRPTLRPPAWWRVGLATVLAIAGSLAADAALVVLGKHVFPATKGFVHFQFHDYAELTVIGVLIACAGWPIVTRITSAPRWLFFRLALAVTLVLFLPDLWILMRGESGQGVLVLMAMHVAIALVTYNVLVHVAPVGGAMESAREAPTAPATQARHPRRS
jgi:hypothetical protein